MEIPIFASVCWFVSSFQWLVLWFHRGQLQQQNTEVQFDPRHEWTSFIFQKYVCISSLLFFYCIIIVTYTYSLKKNKTFSINFPFIKKCLYIYMYYNLRLHPVSESVLYFLSFLHFAESVC